MLLFASPGEINAPFNESCVILTADMSLDAFIYLRREDDGRIVVTGDENNKISETLVPVTTARTELSEVIFMGNEPIPLMDRVRLPVGNIVAIELLKKSFAPESTRSKPDVIDSVSPMA